MKRPDREEEEEEKEGRGYLGESARRTALRDEWAAGGGSGEGKGGGGNLESPSALQPHSRLQPTGEETKRREVEEESSPERRGRCEKVRRSSFQCKSRRAEGR